MNVEPSDNLDLPFQYVTAAQTAPSSVGLGSLGATAVRIQRALVLSWKPGPPPNRQCPFHASGLLPYHSVA